jgi:hypothetical protein
VYIHGALIQLLFNGQMEFVVGLYNLSLTHWSDASCRFSFKTP